MFPALAGALHLPLRVPLKLPRRTNLFCQAPCCRTAATSHRRPLPCIPHRTVLPSAMLPHPCHFTPSSTAMHPAQDCFASRHAAAACHSAASPEPRVITTHKPLKKASAPCKMSSNHKQQNRFNSCERGKCAMQWTQHGGESMAHPRSSRGSILAAGAFTSHAPQHWAKHRSRASHR